MDTSWHSVSCLPGSGPAFGEGEHKRAPGQPALQAHRRSLRRPPVEARQVSAPRSRRRIGPCRRAHPVRNEGTGSNCRIVPEANMDLSIVAILYRGIAIFYLRLRSQIRTMPKPSNSETAGRANEVCHDASQSRRIRNTLRKETRTHGRGPRCEHISGPYRSAPRKKNPQHREAGKVFLKQRHATASHLYVGIGCAGVSAEQTGQ